MLYFLFIEFSPETMNIFEFEYDFAWHKTTIITTTRTYLLYCLIIRSILHTSDIGMVIRTQIHDDVIKWKRFPRNWPFVPTQRPVTRSFDVFFDLRLNKRLSKQPWGWWFETPAWSLWRHRNVQSRNISLIIRGEIGQLHIVQDTH